MMKTKSIPFFLLILLCLHSYSQTWKPASGPLTTQWTSQVAPSNALPEYPRPQMVRNKWKNLNGLWDYAIQPAFDRPPKTWESGLLVPFPVESMLSGVAKKVGPDNKLWYHKKFSVPADWKGQHVLLHFEAVDWQTTVWVNGKELGTHEGGYDAFSFDITSALKAAGDNEIILSVWDPSDAGYQPAGKQWNNPRSIWYTPTTGIWQTVWMEPVPEVSIKDFKIVTDINTGTLKLVVNDDAKGYSIEAIAYDKNTIVGSAKGSLNDTITLLIKNAKLWLPSSPFLYDLTINLMKNGKKVDAVKSYFGMREIRLGKDAEGVTRIFLNNMAIFQLGPLDQGFWPDGIYTAPTDEALKYDIEMEKAVGYNMIRKHVKVEPQRWYYWCDKLGILVWQDMPSGDKHIKPEEADIVRTAQSSLQYKKELTAMIEQHFNHPSIVTWVPFNEGWGQYETASIADMVKGLDHTRLVDATSGWSDRKVSDMHDIHIYPGPDMPALEEARAAVLGEFGGQALVVRDHLWQADLSRAPTHIRTSQTGEDLQKVYGALIEKLAPLKKKGLCAAVYTQTTDVETEVNGIMTYDRKVIKMHKEWLKKIHQQLIGE